VATLLLTLSCLMVGSTSVVAVRYMRRWRVERRDGHASAVLPLHIWCIALSYDLLVLGLAIQSQVLVRWWHPVIYLPALGLGLFAMYVLGKNQQKP